MDNKPEVNYEGFPGYGEDFVVTVTVDTETGETINEIIFLKPTSPVSE